MGNKRRRRGQILVLFALGLVVLIGLAAMGIDVGYMYTVRHELQRCADAGALAGASYFRDTGYWSSTAGDPQMASAEARARMVASRDKVLTAPLDNSEIFVSFPENMRIRVGTQRTVDLFFSRLFLGPTETIKAYAVAEAFPVSQKVKCVVPWGIPAPWNDANHNGVYDAGDSFSWSGVPSAEDCMNYGGVTPWDFSTHNIVGTRSTRDNYLCQGSLQMLKIGDPNQQLQPGNFYGMDFSPIVASCPEGAPDIAPGAAFYSYLINHSCDCDFTVSEGEQINIDTKPGNMVQKTLKPVAPDSYYPSYIPFHPDAESLMNGDPTSVWETGTDPNLGGYPNSDAYHWYNGTEYAGGNWMNSPRVIRVPVYDPSGTVDGGIHTPSAGKTSYEPLAFVGFWVQDIQYSPPNNGSIVGRFITVGGWGGGEETGPVGTPVLNIRLVE